MMLESTTLVAYSVHAIHLIVLADLHQYFTDNRHLLVIFLPVCRSDKQLKAERSGDNVEASLCERTSFLTVPLNSRVRLTTDKTGGEQRMTVL